MSNKPLNLTTPVGRLIGGSLYEGRTTNYEGDPLVVKTGPNAGQPRKDFSFGVAFPKTPGAAHWANEAWMSPVWALARAAFPQGEAQRPDFAWKITDGDSTIPNKKGKKPCDNEGYKGNWVVWFSGGSAPRVCDAKGTTFLTDPDAVKPGYYVQVLGSVADNSPSKSPGLYWNHSIVAFSGFGEEIHFGPSLSEAGFGNAALPPGASSTPPAGMTPPAPNVPGAAPSVPSSIPAYPTASAQPAPVSVAPVRVMTAKAGAYTYAQMIAMPGWTDALLISEGYMMPSGPPAPLVAPAGSVPAPSVPVPIPVTPNPAFVQVPPTPVRVMLPAANGYTYEQLMATNQWTDALLVQHGMMAA